MEKMFLQIKIKEKDILGEGMKLGANMAPRSFSYGSVYLTVRGKLSPHVLTR